MKSLILTLLFTIISLSSWGSEITLSKGIKSKLRSQIEADLEILNNFPFKPASPETLKLLGIETLSPETARAWLEERVKYIIEESAFSKTKILLNRGLYVDRENAVYPFANVLPYYLENAPEASNLEHQDETESKVLMTNVSAAIYMKGKNAQKVYGLKISRGLFQSTLRIPVESPRAGIIQIGDGLFDSEFNLNNQNPKSMANTIHRLSVFFHEARHSDGHGSSLAFAHSSCPEGHDLEGLPACDESLNGAYAVSSNLLKEMIKSCDDKCTEREKEMMKLIMIDNQNRIMKITHKKEAVKNWDASPEGLDFQHNQ